MRNYGRPILGLTHYVTICATYMGVQPGYATDFNVNPLIRKTEKHTYTVSQKTHQSVQEHPNHSCMEFANIL